MTDGLRWAAITSGWAVLGMTAALYQRVGRYVIPPLPIRLALLGNGIITVFAMLEVIDHLGKPLTWRAPTVCTACAIELGALVRLYVWYRQPEGRRQRHAMISTYLGDEIIRETLQRSRARPKDDR